jgi:hypothetical protein
MRLTTLLMAMSWTGPAWGIVSAYEGTAFPEDAGFTRAGTQDADRWVADGCLHQYVKLGIWEPPPYGESDYYRYELSSFAERPFFIEWRMVSDAPSSEVDHQNGASLVVLVAGPVTFHFNMANALVQFYTGYYPNVYFIIERNVPHTHRLEVFGGEWFGLWIDGVLEAADVPEDVFPTSDALMSFGTRYYRAESTSAWDYMRYGRIPADGSGDFDSDESVDLGDFYFFHECLTNRRPGINGGPENDAGPGCRFADFDDDTDVDLRDLADFQNAFTGTD